MLSFTRATAVIRNARVLVEHLARVRPNDDINALHHQLHEALGTVQRRPLPYDTERAWPLFRARIDEDLEQHIYGRAWSPEMACADADTDAVVAAYEGVAAYDANLLLALRLLVATIVVARREGYGGGSLGDVVGLLWINPHADPAGQDLVEKLVHEVTHQCLFVAEMVEGVFALSAADMQADRCLVTSAILGLRRGYARSFHSAVVATMLTHLALHRGDRERASTLAEGLHATLEELSAVDGREGCLQPSGTCILDEMRRFAETLPGNAKRTEIFL